MSGISSTADLLRQSTFNSFGSFRERSGSSFGQISTVDLRGLGATYTTVLINGRRVPGSPFTGSSTVDLNTIPISAIKEMQILKDGASAVYGADAIGGVISIVLKDDFEGWEIGGGGERPSREGADSENFNVLYGKSFDRGHLMIGAEYYNKEAIFDRDRDYSRSAIFGSTFGDTEGISEGGNTGFENDFSAAFPLGSCDTSIYAGTFTDPFGVPGSGCGFAYADLSLQTGNVERKSVFLSSHYELTDDARLYLDARFNNNETSGRFAPAVGFFPFPASSPFNTLGRDISAFHRFVGHGNRDDSVDLDELTFVVGVNGELANGIGYDVWAQYYKYDADERGNTYVQTSAIVNEVIAGNYDVFNPLSQDPIHLGAIERSGVQLTRDIQTDYNATGFTLNGEAFEFGGGYGGWAFGMEYASEDYKDIYDQFREAVDVLGSAGNSASGDRSRWAAFAEYRIPITDNFEVNLAGRYDDYDDFGDNFSPQISAKFSPTDNLTLRASWGEGFRAPALTELHRSLSESFDDLADQFRCTAQGISAADCPTFQVHNFSTGNLSLEAEESENFNIGAVVDFGGFSASLDYYNVEIVNQVTSLTLQQINDLEAAGNLPSGVIVNRGASAGGVPGAIIDIINPFSNGPSVETSGLDLGLNWGIELGAGQLELGAQWVHVFDYDQQFSLTAPVDELIGTENGDRAYIENKMSTSIRWLSENWSLALNSQFFDSFRNASDTADYDSWDGHDFTASWFNAFGLNGFELTAGVLNLTDEEPSIDPVGGYNSSLVLDTYPVAGRIPFVKFKYRLGGE